MTRTNKLVLALLVLLALALACGDPPAPESVPCGQLEGMDRLTTEAVERCGCPEPELVPVWMEIPECEEGANGGGSFFYRSELTI